MNIDKAIMSTTLAAICGLGFAAEGLDRPYVRVHGMDLTPMGRFSYQNDRTVLHPNAWVSVGFDSNTFQTEDNEEASVVTEAVAGIDLRHFASESSLLELEFDVGYRQYIGDDVDTNDDGVDDLEISEKGGLLLDLDLEYVKEGPIWQHNATVRARRYDDPTIEQGISVLRYDYGGSYEALYGGLFGRIPGRVFVDVIDYDEDDTGFDYDARDRMTYGLESGLEYDRSETSTVSGRLRVSQTVYSEDDGTPWQDSFNVMAYGGYEFVVQDVHEFDARLGAEMRSFEDAYSDGSQGGLTYDDEDVIDVIGSLDYAFVYDTDSRIKARLQRSIEDGYASNAVVVNLVSVGATKRLPNDLELLGSLTYHNRQSSGPEEGEAESNSYEVKAGSSYYFRQGMALQGLLTYRMQDAEVVGSDTEWDQILANVAFAAAF
ncbi:MAG: outer membrane beta-barrel protein [Planctomycetota bacterium]